MENKLKYIYPLVSLILLLLGRITNLELVYLICLVPIFLLYLQNTDSSSWIISLGLVLLVNGAIHIGTTETPLSLGVIVYPLIIYTTLYLNLITRRALSGAMRTVIMVAFWLGGHYLLLKLNPVWAVYFPFINLDGIFTQWTDHTGLMGITAWVLFANIIIAKSIYNPKGNLLIQISPSVLIALVIVAIPAFISVFLNDAPVVNFDHMVAFYYGADITEISQQYAERGEWLARTCAWLSVLVLIYSLVKLKTTK
ncbi:hypothetical protein [Fulvivirga lutea]|uniref:Uncharacterized protein n=1 Tax=Fulvivirga lutea TaxID=2810512 RepID=A0A974WIW4_9BACT|nr:hypothetical protein [Fulvivirga lutea]QSE98734.1 hypothetical protein JR347_06545 [Fulvivirga lutea]